jgi:hypothetical protein
LNLEACSRCGSERRRPCDVTFPTLLANNIGPIDGATGTVDRRDDSLRRAQQPR